MAPFSAATRNNLDEIFWMAVAPLNCKFFTWLVTRKRVWTADRLAKRDIPHNDLCVMCNSTDEDAHHLFMGCTVSSIIWSTVLQWADLPTTIPTLGVQLSTWWFSARGSLQGTNRKRFDCLCILAIWTIWNERNNWVFEGKVAFIQQVVNQIKADAGLWFTKIR